MRLLLATTLPIPNPMSASPQPSFHHPVSAPVGQQHPPEWHSPVPYLFGGLAVMIGLIAFALLILACSYWKLSGYPESGPQDANHLGSGGSKASAPASASVRWEKNVLVIMAGRVMPTFLATPSTSTSTSTSTSRSSSFASNSSTSSASVDSCAADNGEKLFSELPERAVEAAGGGESN